MKLFSCNVSGQDWGSGAPFRVTVIADTSEEADILIRKRYDPMDWFIGPMDRQGKPIEKGVIDR